MQRFFAFNSVRGLPRNWVCPDNGFGTDPYGGQSLPVPEGPATRSILLAVLAVPVVESRDARHQADAAEVDLVRARVVTDVVGVAGSVGKHRHPRVACAERMGDARRRGSRNDVSRTDRMLLVAQHADPVAFEDHE